MVDIWALIVGTALLTFCLRYLPALLLRGRKFSRPIERFLYALPIGILTALVVQTVFFREGRLSSGWSDFYVLGLLTSIVLGVYTRNLAAVVFGGLGVVVLAQFLTALLAGGHFR